MDRRELLTGTAALASALGAPRIARAQNIQEIRIGAPLPLTGPWLKKPGSRSADMISGRTRCKRRVECWVGEAGFSALQYISVPN
jgi:hypothetical protein